jgi:hemerythrin-like metal-binding protein
MALVTWSDKLSVGVKSIDEQHTVLFNTINELHAAMMKGQARSKVGELLCTLLVYTRNHFTAEEELMAAANYPGLPQHRILHRELTKKVEGYIERYKNGDITLSIDLASFLSDWLTTHIQGTDKTYGPYLNENGIR